MSVLPRSDRSPAVHHDSLDDELPVSLSISHRAELAVAAAVPTPHFVGVDVERIDPRSHAMLCNYLSPEERQWMAGDPLLETIGWAAKEALYKATRGQQGAAPLDTKLSRPTGPGDDWGPLELSCELAPRPLLGCWRRTGRYVIVLVYSPRCVADQPMSSRSSLAGL